MTFSTLVWLLAEAADLWHWHHPAPMVGPLGWFPTA
jgi:hypothetical protein